MDDPPKAHPWVQAGKMPALPGKAPTRSGFPWDRGRPARNRPEAGNGRPAEGPPVGSSGQDARAPRKGTHAERVSLGPRASRPQPAAGRQWTTRRRPTGGFKRARCPRSQERHPRGAGFPGSAGVPPAAGRRPAMDDPPKAHRCVEAGKMPALPGKAPTRSGFPWDRERPARNRPQAGNGRPAKGPPVGSSGQDARAPRKGTHAERVSLGPRASRPQPAGGGQWTTRRRPTRGFKRARCPRSQGKMPALPGGDARAPGGRCPRSRGFVRRSGRLAWGDAK